MSIRIKCPVDSVSCSVQGGFFSNASLVRILESLVSSLACFEGWLLAETCAIDSKVIFAFTEQETGCFSGAMPRIWMLYTLELREMTSASFVCWFINWLIFRTQDFSRDQPGLLLWKSFYNGEVFIIMVFITRGSKLYYNAITIINIIMTVQVLREHSRGG